jgi:hypothetical protein
MPGKYILRFGFVHYWGHALARVTTGACSLWGVLRLAPTARLRGYLRYAAPVGECSPWGVSRHAPTARWRGYWLRQYAAPSVGLISEYDVLCEISNIYILFHVILYINNTQMQTR